MPLACFGIRRLLLAYLYTCCLQPPARLRPPACFCLYDFCSTHMPHHAHAPAHLNASVWSSQYLKSIATSA